MRSGSYTTEYVAWKDIDVRLESFVSCYAKMNVAKNSSFLLEWLYVESQSFENTIGLYSVEGSSRDDPTPYVYCRRKTPGYPFLTISDSSYHNHESLCNESLAESTRKRQDTSRLACTYEDCDKKSSPEHRQRILTYIFCSIVEYR